MADTKLKECEPDDPLRCRGPGTGAESQCRYYSYAGLIREGLLSHDEILIDIPFCPKHGAIRAAAAERGRYHAYLKNKWALEISAHAESSNLHSLRGEIGVTRMLMQNILAKCDTTDDLIQHSSRLIALSQQIEKLVVSCDKLETKMGDVMDRRTALAFATRIADVVRAYFDDPNKAEEVGNEILQAFLSLRAVE